MNDTKVWLLWLSLYSEGRELFAVCSSKAKADALAEVFNAPLRKQKRDEFSKRAAELHGAATEEIEHGQRLIRIIVNNEVVGQDQLDEYFVDEWTIDGTRIVE